MFLVFQVKEVRIKSSEVNVVIIILCDLCKLSAKKDNLKSTFQLFLLKICSYETKSHFLGEGILKSNQLDASLESF
jgi:hypothetical protein